MGICFEQNDCSKTYFKPIKNLFYENYEIL